MKAISIRQPWAWAILHAGKRVENRVWRARPSYRGPLLIHAAKGCTRDEFMAGACRIKLASGVTVPPLATLPRGALVATARLVDVIDTSQSSDPWAVPGGIGLVLDDVRALWEPIPWNGELGLFDVDVPDHVITHAERYQASRGEGGAR